MPRARLTENTLHGALAPFAGFALPTSNTTYCPNQFFDVCVPNNSRGCVRLVAYLIRKTLGWSDENGKPLREQHRLSYRQLEREAGINRDMIRSAIEEAVDGHFITRIGDGRPNSAGNAAISSSYELKWDDRGEYLKNPKQFRGFFAGEGNRTYIPNQFFDHVVRRDTMAVVKIVGSVIRFSIGFQTKWGHRRQVIALSYQDIQNYAHIRNRGTLSAAIATALTSNYLQRVEEGIFDPNAGKLSKAATYAVKWLNGNTAAPSVRKNVPGKIDSESRSEKRTGNGRKNVPDERPEKRTDIEITETNNKVKQQRGARGEKESDVAFLRLREEGFDARAARSLASRFPHDRISNQICWIDSRRVRSNRLGMLRSAIEQDWSAPVKKASRGDNLRRLNSDRESGKTFTEAMEATRQRLSTSARSPTSSLPQP